METNIKQNFALYVHIPFCVSKCSYCDFSSGPWDGDEDIKRYVDALKKEIELKAKEFRDIIFDSIFFGGGTPSAIGEKYFIQIMDCLNANLNIQPIEFTVEVNPGSADYSLFRVYKSFGVNRISMGLQSANNTVLKCISRIHCVDDFIKTIDDAKKAGFDNINVDIMSGLPNSTCEDLLDSIKIAVDAGACHISLYTLKLEDGTPLQKAVTSGEITLPDEDSEYEMHQKAIESLEALGFSRYEISNYATNDKVCRHNLRYWKRKPYLGIGACASSYYNNTRTSNVFDRDDYIRMIEEDTKPIANTEILTISESAFEMLMLSTRLKEGLNYQEFYEKFNLELRAEFSSYIAELLDNNYIEQNNDALILNSSGLDIQNKILVHFLENWDELF